jgi:hypothetical protein
LERIWLFENDRILYDGNDLMILESMEPNTPGCQPRHDRLSAEHHAHSEVKFRNPLPYIENYVIFLRPPSRGLKLRKHVRKLHCGKKAVNEKRLSKGVKAMITSDHRRTRYKEESATSWERESKVAQRRQ